MNDLQRKEIFENMTDAQVKDMLEDIKALYANGPKMLAELGRISKLPPRRTRRNLMDYMAAGTKQKCSSRWLCMMLPATVTPSRRS
jgi:hypothetical protein